MNEIKLFLIFIACFFWEQARTEEPVIYIYVSFRIVRDFDNSILSQVTEENLTEIVNRMNELEAPFFRGHRFLRSQTAIIGGQGVSGDNPSRWYNTNFFDDTRVGQTTQGSISKDQMEAVAQSSSNYAWNNRVINIYIVNGICGGLCSFPNANDYENIIVFGACNLGIPNTYATTLLHEIGHFFNLCHTHETNCNGCSNDDCISETPKDDSNWSLATIIQQNGNITEDFARNSFNNIMSYHDRDNRNRLTEQQLDRWTDAMDENKKIVNRTYNRTSVRSGSTRFVAPNAQGPIIVPNQINYFPEYGNSYRPANLDFIVNINQSVLQNGDMILLRPGNYNFKGTIRKRVTLRATRSGSVVIGRN